MLRVYAGIYSSGVVRLTRFERDFRDSEDAGHGAEPLGQARAEIVRHMLGGLIEHARLVEMDGVQFKCAYARSMLDANTTFAAAAEIVTGARERLEEELSRLRLLHVSNAVAPYYEEPFKGWKKVVEALPETAFDIEQAGRCLALGVPTASVFHLMRVSEIGLRTLPKLLHFKLPKGKPIDVADWQSILTALKHELERLNQLPKKAKGRSAKITFYSEVLVEFSAFKDAYRNHVAHARARYDADQARSAYNHVKDFMVRLCAGPPK